MLYKAQDNYVNNSAKTVPYGTDCTTQVASVGWTRRLDRRTTLSLKYSYTENYEVPFGGTANYEGSLLYAKLQYRF